MESETSELLIEAFRLSITSSINLFKFLENNVSSATSATDEFKINLSKQITQVKDESKDNVWTLFGNTMASMISVQDKSHFADANQILGIFKEVQLSCHLGFCSSTTLAQITRCLFNYFGFLNTLMYNFNCPSQGGRRETMSVVLIHRIGFCRLTRVAPIFLQQILDAGIMVIPTGPISGTITVPGSKSISNRILLLAALGCGTCRIHGLLDSDDIQCMLAALTTLGMQFWWEHDGDTLVVIGGGGTFKSIPVGTELYLRNSGTASRFLTSAVTLIAGDNPSILTGNARMLERPIGPLVTALRSNGCQVEYLETDGCLPLRVYPNTLKGGLLEIEGKLSSQYVSSILMTAPYAASPLTLQLAEDTATSFPYIQMTVELMRKFGILVEVQGKNRFHVPTGIYQNPEHWTIEPDASSATYPLALAAITGGEITVRHLGSESLQGDVAFVTLLQEMGCEVQQDLGKTFVRGPLQEAIKGLRGITVNMENLTDAFMTVAVLAVAASGTTTITGISNQRLKECNRIRVMVTELTKLGVKCGELADGIWICGVNDLTSLKTPIEIECHDDHRIALSFGVLGTRVPGIVIKDKECVSKTYGSFWDDMRKFLCVSFKPPSACDKAWPRAISTIFLVGMRGCGKSTLGKLVATALGFRYLCMDELLVAEFGEPIQNFVTREGISAFRLAEANLLTRLAQGSEGRYEDTIISTGGGIVETPTCLDILSRRSNVVYLQRDFDDLKVTLDKDQVRIQLFEPLDITWERRKPLFEKCTNHKFSIMVKDEVQWDKVTEDFITFLHEQIIVIEENLIKN